MSTTFTLSGPGISPEFVRIGQLVTDIMNPLANYHRPLYDGELSQPVKTTRYQSSIQYRVGDERSFLLKLTKFFGIGGDCNSVVSLRIEAGETGELTLPNHSEVFRTLYDETRCENKEELHKARKWIQNRIVEKDDIYMVVGVRTVRDAKVTVEVSSGSGASFNAGIPISEIVTGGVSAVLNATDLMIAAHAAQSRQASEEHTLNGEWVIGVRYCKLKTAKRTKREGQLMPGALKWAYFTGQSIRIAEDRWKDRDRMDDVDLEADVGGEVDPNEFVGGDDEDEEADDEDDVLTTLEVDGVSLLF